MSKKLKLYSNHRYTKKIPQFGGDAATYTVISTKYPQDAIEFLSKQQIPDFTVPEDDKKKKVTKITIPKSKKGDFEKELSKKEFEYEQTGMCMMNCDYLVTTPTRDNFENIKSFFTKPEIIPEPVEYRTEVRIPDDKLNTIKYAAKKFKFTVKDAKGNSLPSLNSSDLKILESQLEVTDTGRSRYTLKNVPANLQQDLEYKLKSVDLKVNIQKLSQSDKAQSDNVNLSVETNSEGLKILQTFATEKNLESPIKEGEPSRPFENVIEEALKNPIVKEEPYDDVKFNKLYSMLVDNNEKMKVDGVPLIKKPTELKDKLPLYNLLLKIDSIIPPDDNKGTTSLLTRRTYVATFFITIAELQKNPKSDLTPAVLNNTPAAKFFKKLYDVEKPEGLLDAAGRLIPIISTIRDYYTGKHTVSFDSKAIGEEALKQQVKDVETGIENEFALMSAFIGTKSQKVATKTALLAGMATGLWALVSKIQQNPETSAMLMAGIAAAGPQAIVIGGIIAAVSVSYYIFLKIQDKYAKYFILIRTMNEYMIVLNKIDRLVRLSVRISERYHFDVNLKEIDAQLKVLFKRFDKMLSEDDVSTIEQGLSKQTTIPDLGAAAAEAEAKAEAAANAAMNAEGTTTKTTNPAGQGGGGLGDFMFRFTFDNEMWNQKLNDDVVKLNLYFTTAMTEFSMILNVIQMGFLTSDKGEDKVKLKTTNDLINRSTEYRKMVIGILLNDILKLRVDFSYCNRGGKLTNTKDEGICLDPENIGVDAVGNRRSKFKEKLHGLMEHLVEVLNSKTCPYPPDIKSRIHTAVVEPYKKMIQDAIPTFGPGNKFYLTEGARLNQTDINSAKLNATTNLIQKGGWFFNKATDTKPSPERDIKITEELKYRAYDFVTDDNLKIFLMGVDKFVKAENEPSVQEKEEAKQVANEMFSDESLTKSISYEMANQQPELNAVNAKMQERTGETWKDVYITSPAVAEHKALQAENNQLSTSGGQRLTRKRSFKPKKNRRNTRGLKAFPFKSAAAVLKAYHRK